MNVENGISYYNLKKKLSSLLKDIQFIFYLTLGGMILTHAFYIHYFRVAGSRMMSNFNVFSVVFYIALFIIFHYKKYLGVLYFIFFEVSLHAFLASIVIGSNNGFEFFIVCAVFEIFFLESITKKRRGVILLMICFGFCLLLIMRFLPGNLELSFIRIYPKQELLSFIYVFNCAIAFMMVVFIFLLFLSCIKKDEEILKQQNTRLAELANIDSLTHLLNRRAMKQRFEIAMELKEKYGADFVIAIADIDDFKNINDHYGHGCGDLVLEKVADIVKKNVRETDYVCRWGGEEILILFNKSSMGGALYCTERIHTEIENSRIAYNDSIIGVTVTIGMCSSKQFYLIQDIIMEADKRLYQGKREGKNRIVCSSVIQ